ncbi:N-acetylmuramoyl-L-alanine amidase [Natranaerobius trueperi]|uniref:N-acetylmuramoyl-L-alanine amidase CwlD n=1 Tax=Natranaerobius trueperi TaxID=759412 RepID=A0A226BZJ8_9FIRM|nr:N-acetylmuramoyl-L-alanine amidase [Natranaerobius trueperi]OWZ84453.1 N-acetylmuramoyl-L-alanine amidase CwlD [Natranaerobius trueperi]
MKIIYFSFSKIKYTLILLGVITIVTLFIITNFNLSIDSSKDYSFDSQKGIIVDEIASSLPLQDVVIGLDPGHGGYDPGFFTNGDDIRECDIVLEISLKLRRLLEQAGANVVMTRETDADLWDYRDKMAKRHDLDNRLQLFKDHEVELVLSIHANSIPSSVWRGAQTFYYPDDEDSRQLAWTIQNELERVLENTDRPILPGKYYILSESDSIGALIEAGFLSNPQERKLLTNPRYQERVAWSIYLGVINYVLNDQ